MNIGNKVKDIPYKTGIEKVYSGSTMDPIPSAKSFLGIEGKRPNIDMSNYAYRPGYVGDSDDFGDSNLSLEVNVNQNSSMIPFTSAKPFKGLPIDTLDSRKFTSDDSDVSNNSITFKLFYNPKINSDN